MGNVKAIGDGGAMLDHATPHTRMAMLANIVNSLIRTGDLDKSAVIHLENLQEAILAKSPAALNRVFEELPRGRDPWAGIL